MRLNRQCSCCKVDITTKNIINIGRRKETGLWVNCKACGSTLLFIEPQVRLFREFEKAMPLFEDFRKNNNATIEAK